MISGALKARLQALFHRLGYRIERLRPTSDDAFADQQALMQLCTLAPGVIFDVGAHVGTTVTRYRELFPDATIVAFEPFPASFADLSLMARSDANLKAYRLAVSDVDGEANLNTFSHEQANSLLSVSAAGTRYYESALFKDCGTIAVQTRTIDAFCASENIHKIDILKIDAQGAELRILVGARQLLSEGKVSLIYTETGFAPIYTDQRDLFEIRAYLASVGYGLFNLYDLYRGRTGRLVAADALFLRQDLIDRLDRPEPDA